MNTNRNTTTTSKAAGDEEYDASYLKAILAESLKDLVGLAEHLSEEFGDELLNIACYVCRTGDYQYDMKPLLLSLLLNELEVSVLRLVADDIAEKEPAYRHNLHDALFAWRDIDKL